MCHFILPKRCLGMHQNAPRLHYFIKKCPGGSAPTPQPPAAAHSARCARMAIIYPFEPDTIQNWQPPNMILYPGFNCLDWIQTLTPSLYRPTNPHSVLYSIDDHVKHQGMGEGEHVHFVHIIHLFFVHFAVYIGKSGRFRRKSLR